MMAALSNLVNECTSLVLNGGWPAGFLLVLLESFIPILPLGAFVTLNVNAFGFFTGTILSWIATITGCYITYLVFYYISNNFIFKIIKPQTKEKILEKTSKFKTIKLTSLVLIITLPFAPSCFINLMSGIAGITKQKYLISLIIGKALMITFWAYVGKSLIESLTNIKAIIFILLLLLIAYIITKYITKKFEIE